MHSIQIGRGKALQFCAPDVSRNVRPGPGNRSIAAGLLATAALFVMCLLPPPALAGVVGSPFGWGYYDDEFEIYEQANTLVPTNLTDITSIAGGLAFSLALETNGTVLAWGEDIYNLTNVPAGVTNVVAVAAGLYTALALNANGTVTVWGDTNVGMGSVPASVTNAVAIAGGFNHCMALLANGSVIAWGYDYYGQTNVPASVTNAVAISAGGEISMALLTNGAVVVWGDNSAGELSVPASVTNAVAISAGDDYCLALLANGSVVGWGENYGGQASPPASVTNAVAIAAGLDTSFALLNNGSVTAWGDNFDNNTTVPANVTNAVAITAGLGYGLAILGQVQDSLTPPTISTPTVSYANCLGTNGAAATVSFTVADQSAATLLMTWVVDDVVYQTNSLVSTGGGFSTNVTLSLSFDGAGEHTVVLAGSDLHNPAVSGVTTVIVRSGADVAAWGLDNDGQINVPAGLTNAVAISGGLYDSFALLDNGSVVGWGDNTYGQLTVPAGVTNAVAVSGGYFHGLALLDNGSVAAWGDDGNGQIDVPAGVTNAVAVAAGGLHSLALLANGSVVGWGWNNAGQTNVPVGVTNAVAIGAGDSDSIALLANGSVVVWGDNSDGEATVPAGVTNAVAIAGGLFHNMALLTNGTVVAWGYNEDGQIDVPAGVTNPVAIAAGGFHSMALFADGSVVAWGDNGTGQINVPAGLNDAQAISAGGYHSLALHALQIDLVGPSTTNVECHSAFTDPGATALGPCGVDLTSSITTNGNLDTTTVGNYPITYTVVDGQWQRSVQRTVHVVDTTPPVPDLISLPDATGQCSVTLTPPTATDACAGLITGTTSSSTNFDVQGTNFVAWTYNDGNGNSTVQTQRVIVADTIAPVPDLASLPDVTGQCSAGISARPTATDNCAGSLVGVTADPTNYFTQGTFYVHWTYNDGNGNSTVQTQRVIVAETIAPVISCPTNIALDATNEAGTVFTYATPAASNACSDATVVCLPASGSVFAIGTNTVSCTAYDPHGHTNQCSFTVVVRGALDQTQFALDELMGLTSGVSNHADVVRLDSAMKQLTNSASASAWTDDNDPRNADALKVWQKDLAALRTLVALDKSHHTSVDKPGLQAIIDQLLSAARLQTEVAIANAQTDHVKESRIAAAQSLVAQGDAAVHAGKPITAFGDYKAAWNKVRPPG